MTPPRPVLHVHRGHAFAFVRCARCRRTINACPMADLAMCRRCGHLIALAAHHAGVA